MEPTRTRGAGDEPQGARSPRPLLLRFLEAVDDRVAPTTLSKRTLTDLCHTLEDQVLREDLEATVVAGFQRARFWAVERDRYEALTADPRRRAVVFTADDDRVPTTVHQIVVGEEHDLAREWFVLALTSGFSAVLFGRELVRAQQPEERDRQFLTMWSFDPTVVGDLAEVVLTAVEDLDPADSEELRRALQAVPPRVPQPLMVQRFTNAVFERLEAGQQRLARASEARDAAQQELAQRQDRAVELQTRSSSHPGPLESLTVAVDDEVTSYRLELQREASAVAGPPRARNSANDDPTPTSQGSERFALIVDDEPAIRGLVEALLRRAGWTVQAASNAEEAREATRDRRFDAVLLDIHLAGRDGRDLLTELDRLRPGTGARTVLVTGDPPAAGSPNGCPVVSKPFMWAELRAALDELTTGGGTTTPGEAAL